MKIEKINKRIKREKSLLRTNCTASNADRLRKKKKKPKKVKNVRKVNYETPKKQWR